VQRKRTLSLSVMRGFPVLTTAGVIAGGAGRSGQAAELGPPPATVVGEESQKIADAVGIDGVIDEASIAPGTDEAGAGQLMEMEGKRVWWDGEGLGEVAGGDAIGLVGGEEAEDAQAGFLSKGGE
jgi:hypothetical protein